jgi:hypothetical protein
VKSPIVSIKSKNPITISSMKSTGIPSQTLSKKPITAPAKELIVRIPSEKPINMPAKKPIARILSNKPINIPIENPIASILSKKPTAIYVREPTPASIPVKSPITISSMKSTGIPSQTSLKKPTLLSSSIITVKPSKTSIEFLSKKPTAVPVKPFKKPTDILSTKPTTIPVKQPISKIPSEKPIDTPTKKPIARINKPINIPIGNPIASILSKKPSAIPVKGPTPSISSKKPTTFPTAKSTGIPSQTFSKKPSVFSTNTITVMPSKKPTNIMSKRPTAIPLKKSSFTTGTPSFKHTDTIQPILKELVPVKFQCQSILLNSNCDTFNSCETCKTVIEKTQEIAVINAVATTVNVSFINCNIERRRLKTNSKRQLLVSSNTTVSTSIEFLSSTPALSLQRAMENSITISRNYLTI